MATDATLRINVTTEVSEGEARISRWERAMLWSFLSHVVFRLSLIEDEHIAEQIFKGFVDLGTTVWMAIETFRLWSKMWRERRGAA